MEKKIPRYRQIADAIIEKIGRGDYKVGETLPTRLTEAAPVRARASEADLEPFRAEIDTAILPIAAAGDVASCKRGA